MTHKQEQLTHAIQQILTTPWTQGGLDLRPEIANKIGQIVAKRYPNITTIPQDPLTLIRAASGPSLRGELNALTS